MAAAGNQISNLVKLKLVCRRFNCIIKARREDFPMILIQRLRFSRENCERNEKAFGHFFRATLPISVSIIKSEVIQAHPGRFLSTRKIADLIDLPPASFLAPNDPKISDLMRHFKIVGGRLTFASMKVNDRLISEVLSLDLSAIEELKFYQVKLTASPLLLKSLLEKMRNSLREIMIYYCQFSTALISDDLLSTLVNFQLLSIKENICGEISKLPNLTYSNNPQQRGRKITRCGPELKITA